MPNNEYKMSHQYMQEKKILNLKYFFKKCFVLLILLHDIFFYYFFCGEYCIENSTDRDHLVMVK